jgi:hypothetical protein
MIHRYKVSYVCVAAEGGKVTSRTVRVTFVPIGVVMSVGPR